MAAYPAAARYAARLVVGLFLATPIWANEAGPATAAGSLEMQGAPPSLQVRSFAKWVVTSRNNQGLPFVIVDKREAEVYVYRTDGELRGRAPALLGLARGDEAPADIGHRPPADIGPEERITPAGRFVASLGQDLGEKDVLWIDYEGAFALHRVVTGNPTDHRLRRLSTPTPSDNRISYGCINVAVAFFDKVIEPSFVGSEGIVYVLPEVKALTTLFEGYREAAYPDLQAMP